MHPTLSNPSIAQAMSTIKSMAAFYEARGLTPPTDAEALTLLQQANARDVHLTEEQWNQAWRLGRERCAAACHRLRQPPSVADIDDATAEVVNFFSPEQTQCDTMRNR